MSDRKVIKTGGPLPAPPSRGFRAPRVTSKFRPPVVPSVRIERVRIEAFKSIIDQTLELGRLNVLIGANGSGKSALMEALALSARGRRTTRC